MDDLKPKQKLRRLAGLSIDEVRKDKKSKQTKVLEAKIEAQLAEEKRIEEKMKFINEDMKTSIIPVDSFNNKGQKHLEEEVRSLEEVKPSIEKAKESLQELVSIFGNITDFKVKKEQVTEEIKEIKKPSASVARAFGLKENSKIGFNTDDIKVSIKPEPILEEKKKPVIHKKVVSESVKPITPIQPIQPTRKLGKQSITSQFQEDADTFINLEKRKELYEALKRGDVNSQVYKKEMKALEKDRQSAIDEKKSRIADMHQAQIERMENEKLNPVIQAYKDNKTVFTSKIDDAQNYVDDVLRQLDTVAYDKNDPEVIDERTEVEKMRGELSKFKEMFGQTIKNLSPIITENAKATAQGEISGGGGGEIKLFGLDDIDTGSRFHGAMLRYDDFAKKYIHVDDDLTDGIQLEEDDGDHSGGQIMLDRTTSSGSDEGGHVVQEDFTRNNVLADIVTGATVGSTTSIPVVTFNSQGLITSMTTANISSTLTVGADSGSDDAVAVGTDTLNFAGGDGITTTVTNNQIAIGITDDSVTETMMADDAIGSTQLKTLSTLLIKNSGGTTLKTVHGAGA